DYAERCWPAGICFPAPSGRRSPGRITTKPSPVANARRRWWPEQRNRRMFCSIIIPTIGRASLERAVQSALEQDFTAAPYEVIVVNDSGEALPAAGWQDSPLVRVVGTNRRERS